MMVMEPPNSLPFEQWHPGLCVSSNGLGVPDGLGVPRGILKVPGKVLKGLFTSTLSCDQLIPPIHQLHCALSFEA